ncbi:MAG: phosphoglucosamine mutase [Candidatus Altiarchaeota archaeon]|nr:phosphoglucosamine mutase [Candidatus Altiarchaeota archaeon]
MEHIFRAYDIRGVYGRDLTEDFAFKIAEAFGKFLGNKGRIVVGRDARNSGPQLEEAVARGLASTGISVVQVGLVPIPAINLWIMETKADGGVYISASHNPPEYNGIRFRQPDGTGWVSCIEEVKKIIFSGGIKEAKGGGIKKEDAKNVKKAYTDSIKSRIKMKKKLSVVVDPGNGAASGLGASLFKELGCKVSAINNEPDGNFPGRGPYPNERTLGGLQEKVLKEGADLGVAYDGDSDRVVVVDDKGAVRSAEEVGIILMKELLSASKNKKVAVNIDCSMAVDEEVGKLGGKVQRIRVGDAFLAEAVKKGAVFAMESSSHFVIPQFFPFDDGIVTSAYLAEVLSKKDEKLSELADKIPKYPVLRQTFECPDSKKFKIIDEITQEFKDRKVDRTDGVKINFEDGWILLRASNTQPLLRLTAEAKTQEAASLLLQDIVRRLEGLL